MKLRKQRAGFVKDRELTLKGAEFSVLIADECHFIKNPTTDNIDKLMAREDNITLENAQSASTATNETIELSGCFMPSAIYYDGLLRARGKGTKVVRALLQTR